MGTPDFAATILESLAQANMNILAVYTQPDRPAGRGMAVKTPPAKQVAQKYGFPVYQPASFRSPDAISELASLKPAFLVVASYGLILPQAVLDIPAIAPVNVHASLLPAYRGAAPIQRAIAENWQEGAQTGVSIMRVIHELDAGPVYAIRATPIGRHTARSLTGELARIGAELLLETLPAIANGELVPIAQDGAASYAHRLAKKDGVIDWQKPALEVDALVRAMNPWPGAHAIFELSGKRMPVLIRAGEPRDLKLAPGEIWLTKDGLMAGCGEGSLRIDLIQPEGRRAISGQDFANGHRLAPGLAGRTI